MSVQKIAVVTEDGEKISSHFGMAPFYQVFDVEGDQILMEEQRAKPHHGQHQHGDGHDHDHGHGSQHEDMLAPVGDCQVLVCGGMGEPAYQKAVTAGLDVILAGGKIRETLQAFLRGELKSDERRIHRRS